MNTESSSRFSGNIPSDYLEGHKKARSTAPDIADNYVAHTLIGDPEADEAIDQLASFRRKEAELAIRALMEEEEESGVDIPPALSALFEGLESLPDWFDPSVFTPAARMFHRNSRLVLGAFVGGVLVEGFSTNISKSFFITGRVRDQGVRRLRQNNRHMIELFIPGGLDKGGDGWKLSVRLRLIHAQVRRLLQESNEWDTASWGVPISAAHLGFAITAFSARLIVHMKNLGAVFSDEERKSFMAVWRYTGHLMGIPDTILFRREEDALQLFEIGRMCEPSPGLESVSMANSLINSAPMVIGVDDPSERSSFARYVFRVSRALIGDSLADELEYPRISTFGLLPWFRMRERCHDIFSKLLPRSNQNSNFSRFRSLLEASTFDEMGLSYKIPDHVYSENSSRW